MSELEHFIYKFWDKQNLQYNVTIEQYMIE